MDWITIKRDDKLTTRLFLQRYHFEWKKGVLHKASTYLPSGIALVVLLLHFFTFPRERKHDHFFVDAIMIIVILYIPIYYLIQRIQLARFIKALAKETPPTFRFKFDEAGTAYETSDTTVTQAWSVYKYYAINGNCIYLYNEQKRVREILSAEVIGEENFRQAVEIIRTKMEPKYRH